MSKQYPTPLHLLIDGSDNLGKTTVVNLLSRKLDLPIIKMPNTAEYIEKGNVEEFSKFYNETIVQFAEFSFIMDRGFPSSLVYSKVFHRENNLEYLGNIEQKLNPIIVILTGLEEGKTGVVSFQKDPIWSDNQKTRIDAEYVNLAMAREYTLVCVAYKTPQQICNEIIKLTENLS